jgi:hypothetical protein
VKKRKATEFEQILVATQKAKKSAIGYTIGFVVGMLIIIVTFSYPTPYFIITWGAIIFYPIYAVKNFRKYKMLNAMLRN